MSNKSIFSELKSDLPSGLVVFLVALPLCLGIALASGAPMFAGIIAGIVGGIVIGSLSGSNVSVSGPAAGLTVIVLNAITELGSFQVFALAVVIAGALQVILGFVRAGIIAYYFPTSVIKGMLAAIGIILITKQLPHALGHGEPEGDHIFALLWDSMQHAHFGAIIISIISIAILVAWDLPALKRFSFFRLVPGALLVVALGILLNLAFAAWAPALAVSGNQLVELPVATDIKHFFSFFSLPNFSSFSNMAVYKVAITIAIIASLETLLSIEAADKLDPQKRHTDTNRELKAQGVGNMVSGLIGGLPITAVIVRSSANINAGARTKVSAIFHAVLLLLSAVFIPRLLNIIPLASLAAVLLVIGYKLTKVSLYREMYGKGLMQILPFVITIAVILATDLLIGIGVGLVVGFFFILLDNHNTPYFLHREAVDGQPGAAIRLELSEHVSFLNKGRIQTTLGRLSDDTNIIIDGSRSKQIDYDVKEIIFDFLENAKTRNIAVTLRNIDLAGFVPSAGH